MPVSPLKNYQGRLGKDKTEPNGNSAVEKSITTEMRNSLEELEDSFELTEEEINYVRMYGYRSTNQKNRKKRRLKKNAQQSLKEMRRTPVSALILVA